MINDKDKFKFTKGFIESLPKIVDPKTGCWLYQGYTLRGYAVISINHKNYYIARLALVAYHNIDYYNYKIETCHELICPNKSCFNPLHIRPGTYYDNMQDIHLAGHYALKRTKCPKCDGEYDTVMLKSGIRKGKSFRYCKVCIKRNRKRRTKLR